MIDFGRWANEEYRVPATETAPSAEENQPQPEAGRARDGSER